MNKYGTSSHYCHRCAAKQGYIGSPPKADPTGTKYQLAKYVKHTSPSTASTPVGVFDDANLATYKDYIVNSALSGSVEVDSSGRTNIIWYAGGQIGLTFKNGNPILPNDTVKAVLFHDESRFHCYSISSGHYSRATCLLCGRLVLI